MGLTRAERKALKEFGQGCIGIMGLPECHHSDAAEIILHIHAIQNAVMARAAVRAHPDFNRSPDFK